MAEERTVDPAFGSQRDTSGLLAQLPIWSRYSRPLRVTFPVSGAKRDIAHGLGVTPDGVINVWSDASIAAFAGALWTPTTAYMTSAGSNVHAILIFYTLREEPTNA